MDSIGSQASSIGLTTGARWRTWACGVVAFAVSAGCIDVAVAMLHEPASYLRAVNMYPPLATTTLAAIPLYVVIGLAFYLILGRLFGRPPAGAVAAFSAWFLAFCATLGFAWLLPLHMARSEMSTGDNAIALLGVSVLGVLGAVGAIRLLRLSEQQPWLRIHAGTVLLTAPIALLAFVTVLWRLKYRSLFDMGTLIPAAVLSLVIAIAYLVHWRFRGSYASLALQCAALLAVLLAPMLFVRAYSPYVDSFDAEADAPEIPLVLLITIDTLRGDALSCINATAAPTPNFDRLAADGTLFRQALSAGPWTVPGMGTLMTGTPPQTHRMVHFGAVLRDAFDTLGEHMRGAGYYCGAIGDNGNLSIEENFHQGFHFYDWFPKRERLDSSFGSRMLRNVFAGGYESSATSALLFERALAWLDRNAGERPSFLWLHIYDPHMPYAPPVDFRPDGEVPRGMDYVFDQDEVHRAMTGKGARTAEERAWVKSLYDAEVAYVDAWLGRLFDHLGPLYDESLIVLTSDHGEEFWEHGDFEHGQSLYREMLHVPLIIKMPNGQQDSGGVVEACVSTGSLLPTVCDLLEQPYDEERVAYPSLVASLGNPAAAIATDGWWSGGLMRGDERHGLHTGSTTYIQSQVDGREELYDLQADPGEQQNRAWQNAEQANERRQALVQRNETARHVRAANGLPVDPAATSPVEEALSDEQEERLRSMGYLQ